MGWIFHCPSHDWSKITPWSKLKPQNEPQILSQIEQRNKILDRYSTIGRDINYGDIYRGYGDGYLPFVGYEGKKAIFAFPESNWRSDGIFVEVPGCKSNFTIFMISDFSSNDMENAFKNQNVNCGRGQSYLILKEDKSFFYYYSGSGSITSPETEKSKSMNGKVFKDLISLCITFSE